MKILLCAVLLIAICLAPLGSLPNTPDQTADDDITVSIQVEFSVLPDSYVTPDDSFVLQPGYNGDPLMLIPVEPTNDPGFIVAPSP